MTGIGTDMRQVQTNPYQRDNICPSNHQLENGKSSSPKQVYFKSDDMLFSGGTGTGLSFYLKYTDDSTEENPIVVAKGVDENGKEFEQRININDINPSNATYVEMTALESHFNVDKGAGLSSLPNDTGRMGLYDRCNFISSFEKASADMQKLGKFDLQLFYLKNMNTYLNIDKHRATRK